MPRSFLSQSWYRVADLKPRLRSHADIHRQRFRGQVWYVLQDHATGRFHRFSPAVYRLIGQMDGARTVDEIWNTAAENLGEDLPTQDDVVQLLSQLHASDVLHCDVPPDVAELWERSSKERRRTIIGSIRNPLAMRLPLLDPDRFLSATLRFVRPLFTWAGLGLWLVTVGIGAVLAAMNWPEVTGNIADRVLATENLLVLVLVYPIVKAIHELGHGYAAKVWGGEVHEMGVMFLVLVPVPYVDASAATAFRGKWKRATVGAAGILVELFLAAVAMIVWVNVEPGLVRAIAFNVMLIGGASTLFFNGNPLLRFDGYYVLADLVEIPNLASRANRHILYVVQRRLLGVMDISSPAFAPGERTWFVVYGVAAFTYRVFIMVAIALFVATKLFFIGVILALWAAIQMFGIPTGKGVWFLLDSPRLRRRRTQSLALGGGALAVLGGLFFFMPVPHGTTAEGVVWIPEQSRLYAATDGAVAEIVALPNADVAQGDALVQMADPLLSSRIDVLVGEVAELEARFDAARIDDLVQAEIIRQQAGHTRAELAEARERAAALTVRSASDGQFVVPNAADLQGRFVRRGELVAYVVDDATLTVRVAVPQSNIDLVRQRTRGVEVRFADDFWKVEQAVVKSVVPTATRRLPSLTLSTEGGGRIQLDPTDPDGGAFAPVLQIDLAVPSVADATNFGGRVYVRFDHGSEPLATRLYLQLRRLFLSRFDV